MQRVDSWESRKKNNVCDGVRDNIMRVMTSTVPGEGKEEEQGCDDGKAGGCARLQLIQRDCEETQTDKDRQL